MKKLLWVLAACVVFCALPPSAAPANEKKTDALVYRLPASLKLIEDSAFEGTCVNEVYLPDTLEGIGSRAFMVTSESLSVYIPPSVKSIHADAFLSSADLTIYGVSDSEAERWAQAHAVTFIEKDIWAAAPPAKLRFYNLHLWLYMFISVIVLNKLRFVICKTVRSMRFEDRAELHPIDYCFP